MKKQTHLLTLFLTLLLSACPSSQKPLPEPSGSPLEPVASFPQNNLNCCWEDLLKIDAHYADIARDAYNGKLPALLQLLKLSHKMGFETAHLHGIVLASVLQRWGDARFAWALQQFAQQGGLKEEQKELSESLSDTLRNALESGFSLTVNPDLHRAQLSDFPQTAALLKYQVKGDPS